MSIEINQDLLSAIKKVPNRHRDGFVKRLVVLDAVANQINMKLLRNSNVK